MPFSFSFAKLSEGQAFTSYGWGAVVVYWSGMSGSWLATGLAATRVSTSCFRLVISANSRYTLAKRM
jgi:hypothetical protein